MCLFIHNPFFKTKLFPLYFSARRPSWIAAVSSCKLLRMGHIDAGERRTRRTPACITGKLVYVRSCTHIYIVCIMYVWACLYVHLCVWCGVYVRLCYVFFSAYVRRFACMCICVFVWCLCMIIISFKTLAPCMCLCCVFFCFFLIFLSSYVRIFACVLDCIITKVVHTKD